MARYYVYSTLTNDQAYTRYAQSGNDMPAVDAVVLIKGGVNVADGRLITPRGVVTEIDDVEKDIIVNNPVGKLHLQNGHLVISGALGDPEKVAADMVGRDESAPLVPQDFEDGDGQAKPIMPEVVNTAKVAGRRGGGRKSNK